jgi:hypothetical protein
MKKITVITLDGLFAFASIADGKTAVPAHWTASYNITWTIPSRNLIP